MNDFKLLRNKNIEKTILFFFLLTFSLTGFSQSNKKPVYKTRILFIFDASQSMMGKWEGNVMGTSGTYSKQAKIDIARNLLVQMVDSMRDVKNLELALRVYGDQYYVPPQRCDDTRLAVPFGSDNADKIMMTLKNIQPKGTTPIAHSLTLAGDDFPPCEFCRNVIVLITDGIEACDGDPCAASLELQKKGIILKPFVIGIGLDVNFKKTFECVGNYYDAADPERFKEVLGIVISQALNNTTMQVNLLDQAGNPTETNVNMTFYDNTTGDIRYNFIHTLNAKGNPDTLILSPMTIYKIKVHTIPSVESDTFSLVPGKHKIVGIDAPQGYLKIQTDDNLYKDLQVLVKKDGNCEIINVQQANTTEKYIVGKYDLEILTLPKIITPGVDIEQSHTTTVKIPKPGIVTIMLPSIGYGSIYKRKGKDIQWVTNLLTNQTNQSFTLLPGSYQVIYRAKNANASIYTIKKGFKITSGRSLQVVLKN